MTPRLAPVLLLLLAACVVGEDQNNCNATACQGCCGISGRCESGTTDHLCGTGALACTDCTLKGMRCDVASRSCVVMGSCGAGRCNTGSGSATPCCPTDQPCQSGTQCYTRAQKPVGATCCP